jgi:transposase
VRCGILGPRQRRWAQSWAQSGRPQATLPTSVDARIKELERENAELRRANEILKTASAFFAQAELDRRLR